MLCLSMNSIRLTWSFLNGLLCEVPPLWHGGTNVPVCVSCRDSIVAAHGKPVRDGGRHTERLGLVQIRLVGPVSALSPTRCRAEPWRGANPAWPWSTRRCRPCTTTRTRPGRSAPRCGSESSRDRWENGRGRSRGARRGCGGLRGGSAEPVKGSPEK